MCNAFPLVEHEKIKKRKMDTKVRLGGEPHSKKVCV